jgi:LPXTG-motif cell wall-anchored protein
MKISLDIDSKEVELQSVDLSAMESLTIDFKWTPEETGEYSLTVSTPDDEWNTGVEVQEKESESITGLDSDSLFVLLIIIIVVILIVILLTRKRKKTTETVPSITTPAGPSVFDQETGEDRGEGPAGEPKIIRYRSGLGQVGGDKTEKPGEKR